MNACLLPVVVGVAIASASELNFNWDCFAYAMGSNFAFSLRGILTKKASSSPKASHPYFPLLPLTYPYLPLLTLLTPRPRGQRAPSPRLAVQGLQSKACSARLAAQDLQPSALCAACDQANRTGSHAALHPHGWTVGRARTWTRATCLLS